MSEKNSPYPPYGGPPPPPGPGYGAPPPPGPGYGPPPPQQPVVVEGQKDKKKSKFGGDLGKTVSADPD